MSSTDLIAHIVQHDVKPLLQARGFRKKASLFWRDNGQVIDVVTIQRSQSNGPDSARFTVNLGLYWRHIEELMGQAVTLPREYNCTVQTRIGGLLPERTDLWWELVGADAAAAAEDVTHKLQEYGLPWLEDGHKLDKTMEYLEQRGLKVRRDRIHALRQEGKI